MLKKFHDAIFVAALSDFKFLSIRIITLTPMTIPSGYYATLFLERSFLFRVTLLCSVNFVSLWTVRCLCFSQVLVCCAGARGLVSIRLIDLLDDILLVMINDGS